MLYLKIQCLFLVTFLSFSIIANAQPCSKGTERKHYNFKLLKRGLHIDTSKVRVNGVYISEHRKEGKDNSSSYSYYRFFSNGRVYMSALYCSFPTKAEMNELHYGWYGYYRVDSNKLIIETHTGPTNYYFLYGKIDGDVITTFSTKLRGWAFPRYKEIAQKENSSTFLPHDLLVIVPFW